MGFIKSILRRITGSTSRIDRILRDRDSQSITPDEHNLVYTAGCDFITPYMPLHGRESRMARSQSARAEVEQGIQLLRFITRINPQNWSAHWIIGKGYQAIGDSESACEAFANAFEIEKQNPDVAREYSFECMNLGRAADAVAAATHAVSIRPDDAGLWANLALAKLIAADLEGATAATQRALALDGQDAITRNVAKAISDVQSGRRKQPHRIADL